MNTLNDDELWSPEQPGLTRREIMVRGALGVGALSAASLITACGSSSSPSTSLQTTTGGGTPVRGGTLRIGMISGGQLESLSTVSALSNVDVLRRLQVYDQLFAPSDDLKGIVPSLGLSAESNDDASVWTVELRPDVKWHDGRPFTADDVLYTLNAWSNPSGDQAAIAGLIDLKRMRKRGPLTVEIPLTTPDSLWPTTVTSAVCQIVQDGTDFNTLSKNPIGTGPFKVQSFTPGRESVFVANPDYWQSGKPYLDTLVINSSFTDQPARVNALLSGQIDLVALAGFTQARANITNPKVTVFGSNCPQAMGFVMRVDQGPLADTRVRQAIKLLVDRPALINGALAGFGSRGDDLLAAGAKYYDTSLRSERDVEQARALLKAAGREGATFTLQTTNALPGFVEAATLLSNQAKDAGVTINVDQLPATTYYTQGGGFLSAPFRSTYYLPVGSLSAAYMTYLGPTATLNETHWGSQPGGAAWEKLLLEARAETDESRAAELWAEVQRAQFTDGGLLFWANEAFVSIATPHVKGLKESPAGYLNNGRILDGWLEKS